MPMTNDLQKDYFLPDGDKSYMRLWKRQTYS